MASRPVTLSWAQVLSWRLRRQGVDPALRAPAPEVVRRLCGVQAQVASAADLAVALRQTHPRRGELEDAVTERALVKTWAMRGTLHLLPAADAGAYLALVAAARTWEKGSWQRAFVTTTQLDALTEVVHDVLDGTVLTREELVAEVMERTSDARLAEQLRSGWGAVLKPLAWQGHLCHGPSQGGRVTFTRPDTWVPGWRGLPDVDAAARVAVPAYLAAHGPASPAAFDQWLTRGMSRRAALRGWFADLGELLTAVEVEGEPLHARAEDVEDLARSRPSDTVRLLPAFDQYVLGPGTGDTRVLPAARRGRVSRTAGWIAPVVVRGGRVVGTWTTAGSTLAVELFAEASDVSPAALRTETRRIADYLGEDLAVSVAVPPR